MQKKLLEICRKMKNQEKNEEKLKKLEIIEKILSVPKCFLNLSLETSIDLLMELGFKKDEAFKIYKQETNFNNINK